MTTVFCDTPIREWVRSNRHLSSTSSPDKNSVVETVGKQRLAVENRRDDPEPILAPSGSVVVNERSAPVAWSGVKLLRPAWRAA